MKGISPFIAMTLLIALVISVAILLSPWLTEFIKTQAGVVSSESEEKLRCSYGGIRILTETIECDFSGNATPASPDYLNFTVENSGSIDLYNFKAQVFIGGVAHTFKTYEALSNLSFTSVRPLKPNERATLIANITLDLPFQDADWIKLITQCPGVDSGEIEDVDCTP